MVPWYFVLAEAEVGGTSQEGAAWKLGGPKKEREGAWGRRPELCVPLPKLLLGTSGCYPSLSRLLPVTCLVAICGFDTQDSWSSDPAGWSLRLGLSQEHVWKESSL